MSKPKWIAESTTNELAQEAFNQLTELEPNKQTKRAIKALEEVIERTAQEDKETVEDTLDTVIQFATLAKDLYNQEVEAIGIVPETEEADEEADEEVEVDLDEMTPKELKAFAKENDIDVSGVKGKKGLIEAITEALEADDVDEEEEVEEDDEDEVEIDLEELSLKELRGLAKEYGITSKGKSKDDLIDAITEAIEDDEDEDDEDEDEIDYESLSLKELKALAKSRGLKVPAKPRKPQLIELLEADDEA